MAAAPGRVGYHVIPMQPLDPPPIDTNVVERSLLTNHLARLVLAAFVYTFLASRIVVLLIMTHKMPDLFLHIGHTHVHHLNYGIFILSIIGYYLIFTRPTGKALHTAASIYGIGLALTFDEFGMWMHLGGGYWQRLSFDAVVMVMAILVLIAYSSKLKHFRVHHWLTAIAMLLLLVFFIGLLVHFSKSLGTRLTPRLEEIELHSPA
jgi:hypothetical protein